MVGLTVEMDPRTPKTMNQLARQFPREMRRAQGRAASIVARKMRSAMRRMGNKDTGKLEPLSELRLALHPDMPAGGKLATQATQLIKVQRRGGSIYVGFIPALDGVASRWQDGGSSPMTDRTRRALRIMLAHGARRDVQVPHVADQPQRHVIAPIAKVAAREYPRWVESAAAKLIDKTLTKAGQ